jgi:hypothetical protein
MVLSSNRTVSQVNWHFSYVSLAFLVNIVYRNVTLEDTITYTNFKMKSEPFLIFFLQKLKQNRMAVLSFVI